ncbi:DnaJ-like protein [Spongiibacter sp. IMCC21906]|jgi:hypothetical protein|uniref:DnaJ domain-containing protein n=1 Tax=Spongiibacter sp. IMCC21906 TaxID=1620392 RepID=UPI00062DDD01|nr:DnaJ domain-containing protein [Spongiibacter sp. IMCC21906]AKH69180.1 DnaJ-like protein [Spongiibacter sp. IMCC21906]
MIIRLLIAVAVLYGIFRFVKIVQSKPKDQRRPYYFTLLISIAAAGLVLLSITGRVHWLAGIIGAAMPFVRQFIANHLHQRISGNANRSNTGPQNEEPPPRRYSGNMDKPEALSILGLKEGASEDDIIKAHRHLMQKFHPDRGGNDYLASQLNEAKSVLLNS